MGLYPETKKGSVNLTGAFKIGGVAVTPTAAQLNALSVFGVVRFTFDAGIVANQSIAAHGTGVTLPAHAIVYGGFYDVNTAFTSAATNTGTVAIMLEAANDLVTATAVSNAIYGTIGRKVIVPVCTAGTTVKATTAREITCTVGGQLLTAGKLTGFLLYVISVASA